MRIQRAKFSTNWTSPAHIMSSCNQPVTWKKTFPVGWTMSVGDEDKPTTWLQREGQNMLPITIIQEPLDVLFLRINFQQRECLNDKFQRRIWSLVVKTKGKGFFSKRRWRGGGGGEGDKDTLGSPRYWLPYISLFQAFRSWERRKKIWAVKKTARPILLLLLLLLWLL